MSNFAAVIKSLIGQVFVTSVDGVRRQVFEGDRIFAGEQVTTADGGSVTLEMANGETVKLGANASWQAGNPDAQEVADSASQAPVSEFEQALAAGMDPTVDLDPTAAGPGAGGGGGSAGGGHSAVMLSETAQRVDPTIGFQTTGLGTPGFNLIEDNNPAIFATADAADTGTTTPDTTAPVVTIGIDPITGDNILNSAELGATTVTITGTVGGEAKVGDAITLNLGGNVYNGTVIALGNGALGFSIPVSSADLGSFNSISATVSSSDAAGNVGTATASRPYTVDTTAPVITVDAPAITNDTTPTIVGTTDAPVGSTVTLTITQGTTVLTTTATVVAGGTYSADIPAGLVEGPYSVDAKVTDAAGNIGSATDTGAIDTTAPVPTISLDANITADDVINSTEATQQIPVTGTVGGDAKVGDTVTLTVNGKTFTGQVQADKTFSINVPGADLVADAGKTINASISTTDAAGNVGSAATSEGYSVDVTAPVPTISLDTNITPDDVINSTEATQQIPVTGTVGGDAKVGDTVTLTVNGKQFTGLVTDTNGTLGFSINVPGADLVADAGKTINASISTTDAAGNVGSAATSEGYSVDVTAPVPTITLDANITPDDVINSTEATQQIPVTGTVGGDAKVGDTVTLTVNGKDFTGSVVTNPNGTLGFSINVPGADLVADAGKTINASISTTDAAGNVGSAATSEGYSADVTAPVPTITLDANITPDDVINSTEATQQIPVTGTVGGDAKVGDTVTLTVNGKNFTGQVQADKTFSINVPGADLVADAGKTINASISTTDAAGNVGSAATSEGYSVDVTAPVPTITLDANITPDDVINSTEAGQQIPVTGTVGGDAKVGDTVTLTVNGKQFTGLVTDTNGTLGFSINVPGADLVADAGKTINASISTTDAAGNIGTATDSEGYSVDVNAPTITVDAPAVTNDTTPTIVGTTDAPVGSIVTLTVTQGSTVITVTTPVLAGGTYSVELNQPLIEGPYSVDAKVTDAAGNTGSATDTGAIDTTAPVITVDAPAITNDTTPTIVGTTDAPVGSTVTLTITQGTTVLTTTATVVAGGTYSADVPAGLAEGPYSVDAKVTDAAGNTGSATDTGAIDTTAPVISVDAPAVTNDTTPTIVGTTDAPVGSTVTLTITQGTTVLTTTATVVAGGTYSAEVPAGLIEGPYSVDAKVTDAAGNTGSATDTGAIDTTAPVPTITLDANITPDDVINSTEATQQIPVTGTVGGDAKVGDTVTLTVNGKQFTGQVQADKTFSINVPGADLVADAGKTINASISTTDAAGNIGTATDSESYSVDVTAPVPTITLDANITPDDVINSTEATQQIPVTGTVGGDAKVGDTVTLTVNGKQFTGQVQADKTFSINVPGADLVADAGKTINASISTTDAAGNVGSAATSEGYSVDVTAPVPTITLDANITPDDVINSTEAGQQIPVTGTVGGDAKVGDTVTLTVNGKQFTGQVQADKTFSINVPGADLVADAGKTINASISTTDAAGNIGTATDSEGYSVDVNAPAITVDAPAITNDTTPTIVGTTDAPVGSTVTLTITQGTTVLTTTATVVAGGTYSADVPAALVEGPYSVDAKVTDAAGNTGSATDTGAIDTTAPVITVDAPAITNDTTPTIVGTTDAPVGSTVTLTITQGTTVLTTTATVVAGGTYSADVTAGLAEGPYSVDAKVTDAAGNTGSATDTGAIDTTAPVITVDAPAITNDTTPTIVGTTDAPVGSTVTLTITQGTTVLTTTATVVAGGTYSADVPAGLVEGPYSVDAKVTDPAGNTGSATDSGAIDTTAPVITVDAPAVTNDTTPTIVGTTDAPVGSTVTLTITQGTTVLTTTATVVAGGTYSADVPAGLVEGPYSVDAKVTDAAGNTGSATDTGAIDTTAPVITVDAPAVTNDTTPTIVGTTDAPAGSIVTLTVTQGSTVITVTTPVLANGTYSVELNQPLAEGPYSVDAKVTDAAGNTGSATDTGAIDTTAPVITVDAPAITNDTTPTIVGTTDAPVGSIVTLTVTQGSTVITVTTPVLANGTYSVELNQPLAEGPYSVDAKATDAAGNTGSATDTGAINTTAPVIAVDAPAVTNDTTPTIVGTTDAPAGSIVTLTVTQGSTVITVTTPVLANGTYSVELNQPLAEGPYSVDAKVTDAAGNTGSATDTGAIDTTAPVITVDAPAITNDTTPTIVGTTDAPVGSIVTLTVTQGSTVITVTTPVLANGTYSVELNQPLAEGPYSVDAKATDAAGNTGSATDTGAIDTTAPVITVDAPAITNDTTPTIVGTTDAPVGNTVTLTITQGTTVLTTTATVVAGGTYSADVPAGLVEGPYSVDAKVTDAAGNTGSATDIGAIDTTAPVPTISLDANITADDVINSTEATQQIPVTGTVGGDAKVGDTVTLTVNGKAFTGQVLADKTFSINVPGADLVADAGKTINASISTTDAAGNMGSAATSEGYSVDVTAPVPTISLDANITADDVINSTEATQQIPVTGTVGGDAKVGDTVTLTVNGKTFTGQVLADKTFSINVPGADLVADAGKSINASISTTDAAGNTGTATDTEGYSVNTTLPVPTISLDANITPDDVINIAESTQQIPVTGTVGGDAKVGDTVTLTVNGKQFTGQVLADKTFSINVPGADLVADAGKTINASISTTDAAGNVGSAATSEGYSVDVTAPVPTISLDANITADDVINSTEATQQIPVTGTVGGDAKVGDTVTLSVNGKQFTGQVLADKTFSINVPGADLVADAGKTINASISTTDAAGNVGSAATSEGYSVDVTAPVPTISLDANITADDVINSTEATQQIPVTGTVGGDAKVGDTVTLSVNGKQFTGQVQADKTFSINVPGTDLVADAGKTINASISTTDAAGNIGTATDSEGYSVDVTPPSAAIDIVKISEDTGTPGDFVTRDNTLTVSGTVGPLASGEKAQISVDGGNTWTDLNVNNGTWDYTDGRTLSLGDHTYQVRVVDAAGNLGSTDTQKVTIIANQNPVAVNDPGTAAGLTGQYYAYHEGTNLDGPNLSSLAQVRAFIDANSPDASFVAKNINYSLGGGDLGGNNNLQTFLGSDAASLNVDPENSSDAIIKLSGTLQLQAGSYQFQVRADDGYSISIDGVIVSRFDGNQSPSTNSGSFTISEPGAHTIEIIYWDQGGQAALQPTLSFAGGAYQPLSNFSPTQANPALITGHDNALTISQATLLANDSDADGDTLRIVGVDNPKHGTVTLNDNGTITFTPASNYYGPASFSYTVSDGNGGTSTATVTVNVTGDAAPSIGAVSNAVDSSGNQVDEGDNAVFTVNLSNASITSTTFSLSLNAGTAKAGSDYNGTLTNQSFSNGVTYNAANGTVTVPAGVSSFTVTVPTINDTISEPTETFSLTVGGKSGTATIIDNDGVPTVSAVSSAVDSTGGQVDEGDNAVFTVDLTNAGSTSTTFSLSLNAGTATAGSDYNGTLTNQSFSNGVTYNAANGTVTVPAGVTSFTVTVPTINDTVAEPTENFSLTVGGKTGTATIIDNDPVPTISTVSSAVDSNGGQVDEGDNAVFTVNLTNASSTATTFSLALNAGTAAAGSDYNGTLTNQSFSNGVTYNAANGTVTVPAGVTSFTVTVPTVDDTVFEPAETFSLTVGGKTGTATIVDNDAAPTIGTVSAAVDSGGGQVDEGDNAVFTVNLTNASSTPTTFSLTLNAGTATAGSDYNGTLTNQSFSNGVTYNAANGTVTVPAGVTSFTVTVPTINDTVAEPTENFSLTVGGKTGTATIIDNDPVPTISTVSSAVDSTGGQVDEGDNAVFTVNLTNASSTATTFSLALNAGTATAGSDYNGTLTNQSFSNGVTYNAATGQVTVPAGITSFTVTVPTVDDTVFEPAENFTLTIGGKTGTATIIDNDAAPTVGSVSSAVDSNGGQVDEGDNAVFTVNLTNASSTPTTFSLALNAGTATAGSDYNGTLTSQSFSNGVAYNAANGTVTVPAGVTSFTVTVPTIDDTVSEPTENFTLTVGGKTGTATIVDNDAAPTVGSVSSAVDSNGGQVDEGDNAVFTVNLTNASSTPTTFSLALNAGTATAGSDYNGTLTSQSFSNGVAYNAANGTVTVPAGVTSFTVTVPTIDDTVSEPTENFTLTVGGKTGTATIVDNDAAPTVGSVSSAVDSNGGQVDEGDNAVFTVNLTNASSTPTTFSLTLSAGTATAGSDYNGTLTNQSFSNGVTYNAATGQVTVPAGVTSFTVTVPTINDTVYEQTENFTLNVGGKVGTATIIDNDPVPTVKTIDVGQPGTADDNVIEGNNLVFNVTLSNASSTPTVLSFNATGTATANVDYKLNAQSFSNGVTYDANTGKITVPAGVTSFSVTVQTLADNVVGEPLETVKLDIGGQSATGGIIDGTPDAKDDSYTKVTGLKAEYFGYKEGTGAGNDGANLTNLSQVRQFIDSHKAAATFNATTLDYGNLSNATGLGTGTNLQTFLGVNTTTGNGAKANSLSTDPGDTSDAIIKMSGYINLAAGTYQFRVTADDGYSIRINGQVVAEFNNIQSSATATGKTFTIGAANAGPQQIEIIYWDQGGDARLKVEVGQGGNFKVVDSDMLYHVPTTSTLTMDAGDSLTIASSTLLSNDTDPNNDSLSITSVQNATNGTVTLNNGNVVFTPKSGFYGDASFQYTISDGKGGSDTATVTLKVNQAANVIHVAGDGANDNGNNTINGGAGSDVLLGDAGGTLTTLQPATNYNIALLVDTSGSMQGDRMSLTKTALSNFVKTLAGHDGVVNVTLVGFAEKVTLSAKVEDLQSGTSLDALLANIQKLTASGGTNYEAAFKEASAWFDAQSTAGHTKAAGYENLTFFLSDGDPTYYYNGNTTTLSGNGSTTNNEVLLGSLDTFNVLAGKSSVQAIGIGSGVSEKNLSLYDNTTDAPASTYLANGSQAVLASFNNSTSGWNNLTTWETSGTGGGSSVSRSSDTLVIRDTWGGTPVTAATPTLTIVDGSFSSLKFAYGTTDTGSGDSLTWKLQQLVNGAWTDVQTGGGTTGGNWTSVETSVVGAGTYRLEFSVDDKSFNLNSASMSIDNITRVDYTKVPVGKVEIVNSADELSVALHGGANANVPVSVGNDTIFGGDGNDIIFGDVINTDALPWGVNGNPAKPADMYNGSGVKALETFLELKNGVAPTNADLYDYIRANHDTFNVAGDTRGGADKLYGGNGNDILYGQGGNDLLVGGAGDDILFGGAGADTFAWQKGDFGKDVIKDFNVAEGDTIDLSSLLQDHSNNLDSYLKLVTDNGSSTLLISTKGEFNNADTTTQQVAAKADVQIDLGQASLPSYDINTLIANHTIKVDP
ncbi:Ig-like domain-containing protein [Pseudomonas sp. sia0905]|uniref:Ig-like domain-containing protein n=1 Tax=Pseudomonas sp. sia0905 TaxID=2854783 RepID=UPI001C459A62|nr:Ig-like domain-containing protein [Pseudomonas sp. sia0905]MBV7564673.1 Ig-like domain-containing protein [Pseudomonas sp. sia0905]